MGIIIAWIDTPFVTSMWMRSKLYGHQSIELSIYEIWPFNSSIDLCNLLLFYMQLSRTCFCYHSACPASFEELLRPQQSTHVAFLQIISMTVQWAYPSMDYPSSFPCIPLSVLQSGNYIRVSSCIIYFSRTRYTCAFPSFIFTSTP